MRYVRIFLLNFQNVFERRGVSFVWFVITLFNPLLLLLYWQGALKNTQIPGWSLSQVSSYYFLLVILAALLMSHVEDQVASEDIEQGGLIRYIIRPFSYYWFQFFHEIPYRILQGFFGLITFFLCLWFFGDVITFSISPEFLLVAAISCICAYFLAFTFKMILGFSAFWLTDSRGIFLLMEIITITFAGYVLPLSIMPSSLSTIANILPFAYMIYYPVIIVQGRLSIAESLSLIGVQLLWLVLFIFLYNIIWHHGIKKFTGMGQ